MTVTPIVPPPSEHLAITATITQPTTVIAEGAWPWLTPHTTGVRVAHVSLDANMAHDPVEGFESFPLNQPAQRINDVRRVKLYTVSWCHYCKAFKPVWEQLKQMNYKDIVFEEIDGDKANDPMIKSYPTIIMLDEYGHRRKYDGQRELHLLNEWIRSI